MPSSNTPAKVSDTNGSEGRGGDASDAKSAKKQQWVEEEAVTEDATTSAAVIEANRYAPNTQTPAIRPPSCGNMNNASSSQAQGAEGASQAEGARACATWNAVDQSGESRSPDNSENAPAAELPTSSIASAAHQEARAPQQGHSNRARFSPVMLHRRSTGQQHSQARRRGHTSRASLISAIVQRNTPKPTGSAVTYDSRRPITAVLVDEEDIPTGEVVDAQAVGFFEQKWKLMVFIVVAAAGALLALGLTVGRQQPSPITPSPTSFPTLRPTFDQRPTIEQIQERGFVKCGWNDQFVPIRYKVCELFASVLFGDPSKIKHVPVTKDDRFLLLEERETDVLIDVVGYSIQREVKEPLTKGSYIFSKIYFYSRAIYMGNQTYVECAEAEQRYGHCSNMRICAIRPSNHYDFLQRHFPSDYIVPMPNTKGEDIAVLLDYYVNGTCNTVFGNEILLLRYSGEYDLFILEKELFFGSETVGIEPQGIVTRGDDREFADAMTWVVNALIYGEEQNIGNNPALCQPYDSAPTASYEIDYMLAVYCVGNYGDFWGEDHEGRGELNLINNGTSMILPTRFGDLTDPNAGTVQGTLAAIRSKGRLDCDVVVPNDLNVSLVDAKGALGVSVSYCRALSAAILNGDVESIELLPYSGESDAVEALNNGKVDVVAGAKAQIQYDLGGPSIPGVYFTTPYLYGNETAREGVTMITMATREADEMFCSFVNDMPLVSVFGSNIAWALRDAIDLSGNYYEILRSNDMEGTNYDLAVMNKQSKDESRGISAARNSVVDVHDVFTMSLMLSTPGQKEYTLKQ